MNTVKACVLAAFAILVLGGCTTTRTLSVSQENGATLGFAQGRPWLQSVKRNTVAVWLLTPTYKTDLNDLIPPAFLVVVRNGGDQTMSLSRGDITATADGRPIHILTYEEYCGEIDRQAGQESFRLQEPLGRGEAPNESPELWEPGGIMWLGERLIDLQRDHLLADAGLMLVLDQYLIAPGQAIRGVVRLKPSDLSSGQRLRILVKTGDETHEFFYDVRN
jgi:hypothetical protein